MDSHSGWGGICPRGGGCAVPEKGVGLWDRGLEIAAGERLQQI